MLAVSSHASALSMVFSKSLARRRFRPSDANVRSTTHPRGAIPVLDIGGVDHGAGQQSTGIGDDMALCVP